MKRVLRYGAAAMLILVTACWIPLPARGQGQAEGSFDRTLNVPGMVDLEVSTGSGSIDIRRGGGNVVQIHGTIRAGGSWWRSSQDAGEIVRRLESNPPIEQSGHTVRIGRQMDRNWYENVSISYEIVVPAQANIQAHSGSGHQSLEGVDGRVEMNTGSGGIRATNVRGELRMHTGSGGIRVQGEQTGRWEFSTGSGGVEIDLPSNAAFELNAHTGSGGVDVDYPMTVQGHIGSRRHDVSGKVGGGGPELSIRTGSGHIRIQ
jgi:hypothetical protein